MRTAGRHRRLVGVLGVGAAAAAVWMSGVGFASANAPNPASATDAVTTTHADGTVVVTISGTWDWGTVTTEAGEKSSPQTDCTQRYGVGWAIDWQDPSVAPWNDPATSKEFTITKNGVNFTAGGSSYGLGSYDGFQVGICQHKDANGDPTGSWSAEHTYKSASDVPKVLCVNFYDPHGQENKPSGGVGWPEVNNVPLDKRSSDFIAAGPGHDGDNSIETNAYNPATNNGGNCATPHPAPASVAARQSAPAPASVAARQSPPAPAQAPVVAGVTIAPAAPAKAVAAQPKFTG